MKVIPITRSLSQLGEVIGRIEIEDAVADELARAIRGGVRFMLDATVEINTPKIMVVSFGAFSAVESEDRNPEKNS